MIAEDLVDVSIECPDCQIVVELPNGQYISTTNYYHSTNMKGEPVIVIQTSKKLKRVS